MGKIKEQLNRFSKILQSKPKHIIDACVIFAATDENEEYHISCDKYLKALNKKYLGYTTIPILGETVLAISKSDDKAFREAAYDFLDNLIKYQEIKIVPHPKEIKCKLKELFEIHNLLDHDDACHLSHAIHTKIKYFVTIDKNFIDKERETTMQKIKDKLNLEIRSPAYMINKLDIR